MRLTRTLIAFFSLLLVAVRDNGHFGVFPDKNSPPIIQPFQAKKKPLSPKQAKGLPSDYPSVVSAAQSSEQYSDAANSRDDSRDGQTVDGSAGVGERIMRV